MFLSVFWRPGSCVAACVKGSSVSTNATRMREGSSVSTNAGFFLPGFSVLVILLVLLGWEVFCVIALFPINLGLQRRTSRCTRFLGRDRRGFGCCGSVQNSGGRDPGWVYGDDCQVFFSGCLVRLFGLDCPVF